MHPAAIGHLSRQGGIDPVPDQDFLSAQGSQLVVLRHATSGVLREELVSGKLDCCLILGPSEPSLERRDLRPMGLVVGLPPGSDPSLPWEMVRELQWIGTPSGCPFRILGQELFKREGSAPKRRFEVEIERTIVEMVAAGLGAGLVREDTARWAVGNGKCVVWEGRPVESSLALVWPREKADDPAVRALRRIVDEVWS
jgi:DNA-binding transcriptional LysR family regulator